MRYRLGPDVGLEESDGSIYVAPLPGGPILVLEGVAALIFTEATAGDREHLADRVSSQVDGPPDEIQAHVTAFVDTLVSRGILEPTA
jgi:hypothetical protein